MRASGLAGVLCCTLALVGVPWARFHVARAHAQLRKAPEFYSLPQPAHLKLLSLGYHSALADLLFGKALVDAGIHFSEKRVFEALPETLDAVVTLDPGYRDVYFFADSLLTLSTARMPARNYRVARDLQERGRRQFPDDAQLWLSSGQFMAYMAPPFLAPEENPREWRIAAAKILQHACDIWPDPRELPPACLGTSTILSREGELDANVEALRRLIAIADDPAVKGEAMARLRKIRGLQSAESEAELLSELTRQRERDLPLASRASYQLIGPPTAVAECVGALEAETAACVTSFRAWADLHPGAR